MNEIKLSCILGNVAEQSSAAGSFLTARLRFNRSDEVLLVVVGEKMDAFGPFDVGDAVRVIGRLALANGGLTILVDECAASHRQRTSAAISRARKLSTGGTT